MKNINEQRTQVSEIYLNKYFIYNTSSTFLKKKKIF